MTKRLNPTTLRMEDVIKTLEYLGACESGIKAVRRFETPHAALYKQDSRQVLWLVNRLGMTEHGDREALRRMIAEIIQRIVDKYSHLATEKSLSAYKIIVGEAALEEDISAFHMAAQEWVDAKSDSATECFAYAVYSRALSETSDDVIGHMLFRACRCELRLAAYEEGEELPSLWDEALGVFLEKASPWLYAAMETANEARIKKEER